MDSIVNFNNSLQIDFYKQKTETVAKLLIGKLLVKKVGTHYLCGEIVETEAYIPFGDMANHSSKGKTLRNAAMFEDGGILYIYQIYGVHHCINIVTETEGLGSAVLLRAIKPISGINQMSANRNNVKALAIAKGPGNLAKAYNFNREDNYKSLLNNDVFVQNFNEYSSNEIIETTRIGISQSKDLKLRYYLKNSNYISKP